MPQVVALCHGVVWMEPRDPELTKSLLLAVALFGVLTACAEENELFSQEALKITDVILHIRC